MTKIFVVAIIMVVLLWGASVDLKNKHRTEKLEIKVEMLEVRVLILEER